MDKEFRLNKDQWLEFQAEVFDHIKEITRAKNADYTGGSDDPFANFRESEEFGVPTLTGLCVRMGDKFQRVKSYLANGKLEVANEGLEDAFYDLIGYSALALGLLKEQTLGTEMQVVGIRAYDDEWGITANNFINAMENVQ